MYTVPDFGRMIADEVRTTSYAEAILRTVSPQSVVLDIGAGTGILSLLACRSGARRVYAVEPSDALGVARQVVGANGMTDRVVFIPALSTAIDLPEPVDIIVSSLHGVLIPFQQQFLTIADARRRFLAPGGAVIPARESLWVALVEAPDAYADIVEPWEAHRYGFDMSAARRLAVNSFKRKVMRPEQLLTEPTCWATVDYSVVDSNDLDARVNLTVLRPGVAHGLLLWFDSHLVDGIGFSNAPGQPATVFGSGFFPWHAPVALKPGDSVTVRLRANLVENETVWGWESWVSEAGSTTPSQHFRQSTFLGTPIAPNRLRKRGIAHRPVIGEDGQVDRMVLELLDGTATNGEIAIRLQERFPSRFVSTNEALRRVGTLVERYDTSS